MNNGSNDGVDPLERLFDVMHQRGPAGSTAGRARPVTEGWTLDIPRGELTELNIVSLYKSQRFVAHPDHQTQGWNACSVVNRLKRDICANPAGCSSALLESYIGALAMVREHVVTNDRAYVYNEKGLASPVIDFELYMTLATLAARDTAAASSARRLQTDQGYVVAFDHYVHAAEVLEETVLKLCQVPPPRERVHHGQPAHDWLPLVGPGKSVPVAKILVFMTARANMLRCEAYVAAYRAIAIASGEDDELSGDTLDGSAAFVAQKFDDVVHALARTRKPNEPCTRMELYASFMGTLFRLLSVTHQTAADLAMAEDELSPMYLARALRRLDRAMFRSISREEWAIVDADTGAMMHAALGKLDSLRARAETLRSQDTTAAFALMDMSAGSSAPPPIDPIDPSFAVGHDDDDAEPSRAAPFSLRALRNRVALEMPDLLAFLELRTDQRRAMNAIQSSPSLPMPQGTSEHGRGVADAILAMFVAQLERRDTDTQWRLHLQQRVGTVRSLADIMGACFSLGRLAERSPWNHFVFSTEEPVGANEPPSETMLEMEKVDAALLNAAKYFVDLGMVLDLKPL